jgi:hypothetical protein
MAEPALGGYGNVSTITPRPIWQTHVSGINAQRSNIGPLHSLNHGLVFSGVADDEDNESPSFHVQGQRSCQRKRWRSGDNDDISSSAISCPPRSSCLSHGATFIVSFINNGSAGQDDHSSQNFVLGNPVLEPFEASQGNDCHHFFHRRLRPDRLWHPFRGGQSLSDDYSGAVDILINELGSNVGVLANLARELQYNK